MVFYRVSYVFSVNFPTIPEKEIIKQKMMVCLMRHLIEVRRKDNLFSQIEQSRRKKEGLELIIGTGSGRQYEAADRLRGIGKITRVYDEIPYFSIKTCADDAALLAGYVHRDSGLRASSESFERTYKRIFQLISSVDASSRFRCTPIHKRGNFFSSLAFERLWNLENVGAYGAQQISAGEGVKIGIIDTGVDYNHAELRERFEPKKGYDFVRNTSDPMDREGHGTHVAGTACSENCGVSIDSTLYGVRVLDESGSGSEADIIAGIEWCLKNEVDVANMSLGCRYASRAFEAICDKAYESGLILVAAAGNEGYGADYPAAFGESVIGVAAVDSENEHASFSNIWQTNDISAPGVDVLSCARGGGYVELSGTSMASPHVTGGVALAISMCRDDPGSIEDYMEETAQELEGDGNFSNDWVFGAGLLRADRLLSRIVSEKSRLRYAGKR